MQVLSQFNDELPAGDHVFRLVAAADYVMKITANNGGPTALSFKDLATDSDGIEDAEFVSGAAYASVVTVPLGSRLYITLAGAETVSFRLYRRPDA